MTELAELQICLLGSFQVLWDFMPVAASQWRSPAAPKLLKLVLITRPDPVTTEDAVRLLGPGGADLPAVVEQVRRVLEPAASLSVDEHGLIRLVAGSRCWIDLDALLAHYDAGVDAAKRGEMLQAILSLQEADALYQGDLLEEMQESWVLAARKRMRELYAEILERLAEGHAVLARYQDAVGFCYKALAHEPLREETYQRMMAYYYYLGDRAGIEQTYLACQGRLESAGRSPGAETVALRDRLVNGRPPNERPPNERPSKGTAPATISLDQSRKNRSGK